MNEYRNHTSDFKLIRRDIIKALKRKENKDGIRNVGMRFYNFNNDEYSGVVPVDDMGLLGSRDYFDDGLGKDYRLIGGVEISISNTAHGIAYSKNNIRGSYNTELAYRYVIDVNKLTYMIDSQHRVIYGFDLDDIQIQMDKDSLYWFFLDSINAFMGNFVKYKDDDFLAYLTDKLSKKYNKFFKKDYIPTTYAEMVKDLLLNYGLALYFVDATDDTLTIERRDLGKDLTYLLDGIDVLSEMNNSIMNLYGKIILKPKDLKISKVMFSGMSEKFLPLLVFDFDRHKMMYYYRASHGGKRNMTLSINDLYIDTLWEDYNLMAHESADQGYGKRNGNSVVLNWNNIDFGIR